MKNKRTKEQMQSVMAAHIESAVSRPRMPWVTTGDRTCLSHWFPLIEAAGVPVPRTRILRIDDSYHLGPLMNGPDAKVTWEGYPEFLATLRGFGGEMGWPCFLRTGQTSGKHSWSRCCFLPSPDVIESHISELVCFSEIVGLLWDVWVVREMLPTNPAFRCFRYSGFPVVREFRVFVEGPRVLYVSPYWPVKALREGEPSDSEWIEKLSLVRDATDDEMGVVRDLASRCGAAIGGRWSVDVLDTERGWYVTDMAEAEKSYGWDESRIGGDA